MKRILFVLPLLAIVLLAASGTLSGGRAFAADANLVVKAGGGETGFAVNQFMPNTATVPVGSTITWDFTWGEPHTVTFGAPGAPATSPASYDGSAGVTTDLVFGPGQKFDIKFTKGGSFNYLCLLHPKMTGTVNVIAAGGQGTPDTQLSADTRGNAQSRSATIALKALAADLNATPASITQQPGGATLYGLIVGGVTSTGDDVQQFFPGQAKIKVGDSIKWINKTETPHTVSFNAPAGPPQGDPLATPILKPAPAFDGTGFWNSGTIWTIPDPASKSTFEMTFSKAGTFTYVCILHAPQGMVASVNVDAAPVAPRPPSTGSGTVSSSRSPASLWLALTGLATLALGSAVFAVARRRPGV